MSKLLASALAGNFMIEQLFGRGANAPILQSEAAECGLACMAMVLRHHGRRTELRRLRGQYGVSIKGAHPGLVVVTGSMPDFHLGEEESDASWVTWEWGSFDIQISLGGLDVDIGTLDINWSQIGKDTAAALNAIGERATEQSSLVRTFQVPGAEN